MNSPKLKTQPSTPPAATSDRAARALATLIALLSFAAFLPALSNQFVNWDDYEALVNNPHYRGLEPANLIWMFTTFHMGHYQPLSWLSFAVDFLIWGADPFGYHLTNLILHAANAVSFFYLARRLLERVAPPVQSAPLRLTFGAALAALAFSLHPLRVESVVWATERRDVLSALFYFLSLHAYVSAASATHWRGRRLALSVVLYALSLLAKGTAMTLPVVLLLLDVYPLRRLPGSPSAWLKPSYRGALLEKLPYLVLAAIFAASALLAQQASGALRPVQQYFISYRIGQFFYALYFYLWKTVLPFDLSPLYELPYDFEAWIAVFYLCAAAALGVTAAFYRLRLRAPALLASWVYYVVVLAPVAGWAQSGPQLVADRYSYLSCLSWALLLGGGLHYFWSSKGGEASRIQTGGIAAVAGLVLAALGALSWQQSQVWRDTATLWRHVIAIGPPSSIAYFNLGRMREERGDFAESLRHYRRALEINPLNPDAHYNLARLLAKRGEPSEAMAHYRAALKIRPNDADAHNNLGLLLAARGEPTAAIDEFQLALEIDPNYAKAFFNKGRVLAQQNDLDKAIENYRRALGLAPNEAEIHVALARALAAQGKTAEAEKHYQEALGLLKAGISLPPSGAPVR